MLIYFKKNRYLWNVAAKAFIILVLFATPVQAFVLDWDTLTSGGTTNLPTLPADQTGGWVGTTYNNVDGSGIDVTIEFQAFAPSGTVTVDTTADYVNRVTPISGDTEGGAIRISYNASNSGPYIRTRITFSEPVQNFQMEIWDVDRASWRDEVRNIRGVTFGSPNVQFNPASITTPSTNTVGIATTANSATAFENPNPNNPFTSDGGADVVINFGSTPTDRIRFDYGNAAGGVTDPATQLIWISGFSFQAVPEPSTYVTGLILLVLAGWGVFRQWRQKD